MKLPAFTFSLHRMKINGRKHNAPKARASDWCPILGHWVLLRLPW